jgi:D-3-phosphoglycerate dehydrogenase
MTTLLVATVKPFAPQAVEGIKKIADEAGYEFRLLEEYSDQSDLIDAVADADALIVRSDKVTREVIQAGNNLKVIVRGGAGYDNIDLEAASERGIVVMNTPGQNANAVAELTFGMLVYFIRKGFSGKAGTELRGKKLGIHAYGHVGKSVAEIAKGFGMEICAFDPYILEDVIEKDDVVCIHSAEELYSNSNYVSLNLPANEETVKSINYDLISRMPVPAILVNTARKELIDEEDLLKIFEDREDFAYISDIAPDCKEVIEKKYPGRFFFTPKKMGAQTKEANINAGLAAASQIRDYFEKGDTTFQVNK